MSKISNALYTVFDIIVWGPLLLVMMTIVIAMYALVAIAEELGR